MVPRGTESQDVVIEICCKCLLNEEHVVPSGFSFEQLFQVLPWDLLLLVRIVLRSWIVLQLSYMEYFAGRELTGRLSFVVVAVFLNFNILFFFFSVGHFLFIYFKYLLIYLAELGLGCSTRGSSCILWDRSLQGTDSSCGVLASVVNLRRVGSWFHDQGSKPTSPIFYIHTILYTIYLHCKVDS